MMLVIGWTLIVGGGLYLGLQLALGFLSLAVWAWEERCYA